MTAILAIRKRDSIEVMTDSASICARTGVVRRFMPKQIWAVPGCAVAVTGTVRLSFHVSRAIFLRGITDFDSLVDQASEIVPISGQQPSLVEAVVMAGWSQRREAVDLYSIDAAGLFADTVVATGPTEQTAALLASFTAQLDPEGFTVGDGVALFEELRTHHRQFAETSAPAVGGEIHHTAITREGTSTSVVHRWRDEIGQAIRLAS